MKKIKTIKQLARERKRLQEREKQLIQKISLGWKELKDQFRPQNRFAARLMKYKEGQFENGSLLKDIISFVTMLIARKLAKKTEEKIESLFS